MRSKKHIIAVLDGEKQALKEDLDDFTHPLWDVVPSIHNFTETIHQRYKNSKLIFQEFREKIKNQTPDKSFVLTYL